MEGSRIPLPCPVMLVRSSPSQLCTLSMAEDVIMSIALQEVAEFLASQTLTVDVDTVSLAQHFPRSVASAEMLHI